jgi:hypothetical protein
MGNWELGIGNWELGLYSISYLLLEKLLTITHYPAAGHYPAGHPVKAPNPIPNSLRPLMIILAFLKP